MENTNTVVTQDKSIADQAHARSEIGLWLDTAIPLDGVLIGAEPEIMQIVDDLLPNILNSIKEKKKLSSFMGSKSKTRINYACKVVLFNLYVAYELGIPVRYSRRKSYYTSARRYGKLHFKYKRIIAIIDAFSELGLIECKIGKNSQTLRYRRQSRMWASEKLFKLFEASSPHPLPVYRSKRVEYIELRDEEKIPIDYNDTDEVVQLRTNVDTYNKFITAQQVELKVDGKAKTNLNTLKYLVVEVLKGNATVKHLELNDNSGIYHQEVVPHNHNNNYSNNNTTNNKTTPPLIPVSNNNNSSSSSSNNITTSISGTFFQIIKTNNDDRKTPSTKSFTRNLMDRLEKTFSQRFYNQFFLKEAKVIVEHPLRYLTTFVKQEFIGQKYKRRLLKTERLFSDFKIINLQYNIQNTSLYRVFNNSSFKQGGRFYGATYQKLSEELRGGIVINGEPTVEYDYSAHHIRMPYHLIGIDYQDDPYLALTEEPRKRKLMKKLLLIAMNAESEENAIVGFRGEVHGEVERGSGILTTENIKKMLEQARKVHAPIAKYIHSGAGRMLQNIDSQITEAILMRMTRQAIPCLPVHDSYIVPVRHREVLYQAMIEEYEKVMGFTPVVK